MSSSNLPLANPTSSYNMINITTDQAYSWVEYIITWTRYNKHSAKGYNFVYRDLTDTCGDGWGGLSEFDQNLNM